MKKIPVIRQHDLKDCGVASLASIISYYDGYIPMERLRMDTHTTKDGTTAYNLLNAANKYGFETKGVKISSLDDANIFLPAIAHLNYKNGLNHFVVIYEITKHKVILMDPAKGRVTLKREEFLKDFSKVLLMFYPKEKIVYLNKGKNILQVFFSIISNEKKLFLEIIFISILLMITTIIANYYFKIGIESLGENTYTEYLKLIVLVFGIITIYKCIFTYIRGYLENHLNKNIDVYLLSDFFNHLFKIPSHSITSRSSSEILARVNELNNIKSLYTEIFVNFFIDFILTLAVIPILLTISSKMLLILFIIVIIYFLVGLATTKTIYQRAYQNITLEEEFNNYLLQSIRNYSSIKGLNITPFVLKTIEEKLALYLRDNFTLNEYFNKCENIKNTINELGFFIVNTLGIYSIMHNTLSISNLITFNSLMLFFLTPIKNLIDIIPKYNFLKATFDKISDFLNIPTEKVGKRVAFNDYNIMVDNLNFSYNDYKLTLENVSFNINQGSKIMFKGKSGCGKSTMCKLLIKDYQEYDGNILIGNKDLKDYSLKSIRDNILYVGQNENLFSDTIRNNIILGRQITEDKFRKIIEVCALEKVIASKPFRYDTFIDGTNKELSGGEKQRIILARALLKDAKIIILDEALSEVDYEVERLIINNLKNFFDDKTIIYITHKNQDDLFDKVILFGS